MLAQVWNTRAGKGEHDTSEVPRLDTDASRHYAGGLDLMQP
jgi:hypothetical protein